MPDSYPSVYAGNCKLTVADVEAMVPMFLKHTDAEIAAHFDHKISRDQVRNIRLGRSWASVTNIGLQLSPVKTETAYKDRRPNHRQSHPSHPLYKITYEINNGVGVRLLGLLRERGISNTVAAASLQMTESALNGKLYRRATNAFSVAQVVIMRSLLFPDVCLTWLLTGVVSSEEIPEYVKIQEYFELNLMIKDLLKEAGNVENK